MDAGPEAWFRQAGEDLEAARYNLEGAKLKAASFLAHQAAEKPLRAVYIKQHDRLWKTHDLVVIAEEIDAPSQVVQACEALNPHYLLSRYPTGVDQAYDKEDAASAVDAAEEVLAWAKRT